MNETCEKLATTLENIEDHCKTYMKDYFKRKGKSEAEVRAETVRKMQERLKAHLEKPEFPWDSFTVSEEVIDQIANELLNGEGMCNEK